MLSSQQYPYVSVVVPTFNESSWIAQSLSSLLSQTYPSDRYEIIVVDNGSTDNTAEIARRFDVELIREPARSSYRARNRGIKKAKGHFIAFVDGDCIARPDWLQNLVNTAMINDCNFVAGKILNIIRSSSFGNRLIAVRHSAENRRKSIEQCNSVPAGNMLVSRRLFDKFGLFNEFISGCDTEFSKRVGSEREKILYAQDAIIKHQCQLSNLDYLKRSFRIRYGQELNRQDADYRQFLKAITDVPWRPGIRAVIKNARLFNLKGVLNVILLWLYMWIDRFASYSGAVAGAFAALDKDSQEFRMKGSL